MDDLAQVWCEWCEMELRHQNFKKALELMRRGTAEPVRGLGYGGVWEIAERDWGGWVRRLENESM